MPDAPQRLGPYRLLRPLGAGGMGEVFLAQLDRDEGFRKLVALKRMRPELATQAAFRDQFAQEARLAASLNHPHVAQVLDYGREGDQAYLAMEWVEGLDLARLLQARGAAGQGPGDLPLGLALAVGLGCLRALAYAHAQTPPVVHGDLGPSNVLLGRAGEVKLADFGLARLQGLTAGPVRGAGKPAYLAPEVARGAPAGPAADLFGLGGVLLELLTGAPPWPGPSPGEALAQARSGAVDLAARAPVLQPGLRLVLGRALAAQPAERYAAAADMLEDLERLAAGLGVDAGPRSVAEQVAAFGPSPQVADPPLPPSARTRVADRGVGTQAPARSAGRAWAIWLALTGSLAAAALAAWLALRPQPLPPISQSLRNPGGGEGVSLRVKNPEDRPSSSDISQVHASMALRAGLAANAEASQASPPPPSSPSKKDFSSRDKVPAQVVPVTPDESGPDTAVSDPGEMQVRPEPGPGVVLECAGLRGWAGEDGVFQPGPLSGRRFGPGVHGLRLQAAGLEVQLRLEVPAGAGQPARLALRSVPAAVVRLDGKPRGMTPLGGLQLAPGSNRLELAAAGEPPLALTLAVR
jgi:eukaryotic-like serine/threonine-protein kinase